LFQQRVHVLGVFLLHRQDALQHAARGGIVGADVGDHLAVAVDRDAFGDQILLDHVDDVLALDVVRMTAAEQALGRQVRLALELGDALRDLVGVPLFLVGMLQELGTDRLRVDPRGHVVVVLVAQHAHQLGGQGVVEQLDDGFAIGAVASGHGAAVDVLTRALADVLEVADERLGLDHGLLLRLGRRRQLQAVRCAEIRQA
jgi:hypothetical protein